MQPRMVRIVCVCAVLISCWGSAWARTPEHKDSLFLHKLRSDWLSFHSRAYTTFTTDFSDSRDIKTGFELTRLYFTMKAKINSWLKSRLTFEVGRFNADEEKPLFSVVKYAYFDATVAKGLWFRVGQQEQPWVAMYTDHWRYRFVDKVASDFYRFINSSELGLTLRGVLFKKLLQFDVGVLNGSGNKEGPKNEPFEDLLILARVSVYPLVSLSKPARSFGIHGYFQTDQDKDETTGKKHRGYLYGGGLSFHWEFLDLSAEFLVRDDNQSATKRELMLGAYLSANYKWVSLFGRVGLHRNPNKAEKNDLHFIVGIAYRPAQYFAVAVDYQQRNNSKHSGKNTKAVVLNTLVKF